MYCVIVGTDTSVLNAQDFNVFGPFTSESEAQQWINNFQQACGDEDEAYIMQLYDPARELSDERTAQAEALADE